MPKKRRAKVQTTEVLDLADLPPPSSAERLQARAEKFDGSAAAVASPSREKPRLDWLHPGQLKMDPHKDEKLARFLRRRLDEGLPLTPQQQQAARDAGIGAGLLGAPDAAAAAAAKQLKKAAKKAKRANKAKKAGRVSAAPAEPDAEPDAEPERMQEASSVDPLETHLMLENSAAAAGPQGARNRKLREQKTARTRRKKESQSLPTREESAAIASKSRKRQAQFLSKLLGADNDSIQAEHIVRCAKASIPEDDPLRAALPLARAAIGQASAPATAPPPKRKRKRNAGNGDRRAAECGAPIVAVVAGAAIRIADGVRVMGSLAAGGWKVTKLMAKDKTVAEHAAYLRDTPCRVCVGTPNRLLRLSGELAALTPRRLSLLVIDTTSDAKGTLFDKADLRSDLAALLNLLLPRIEKGQLVLTLI